MRVFFKSESLIGHANLAGSIWEFREVPKAVTNQTKPTERQDAWKESVKTTTQRRSSAKPVSNANNQKA